MTSRQGNINGILAILLWSISPLVFTFAQEMPTLLKLSLFFVFGGTTFIVLWFMKDPAKLINRFKIPMTSVLLPLTGIGVFQIFYFYSFSTAPIEEANLIVQFWPVLFILMTTLLPNHKMKWNMIFGLVLGVLGILCMLSKSQIEFPEIQKGHVIAFFAAIMWCIYCLLQMLQKDTNNNGVPISFILNGILFSVLYIIFGVGWDYNLKAIWAMLVLGSTSSVAFFLWENSMKYGNIEFLKISSYSLPFTSTAFLVAFGYPVYSNHLGLAVFLIICAFLMTSKDELKSYIIKTDKSRSPKT